MDTVKSPYLLGWSVTIGVLVLAAELSFAAITGVMAQVPSPPNGPTGFDIGNFVGNATLAGIFWYMLTKTIPAREEQREKAVAVLAETFRLECREQRAQHMETVRDIQEGFDRRQREMLAALRGNDCDK